MKTAVQQIMLGSVTGTEEKARETLRRVKAAGYDALELNQFMIHPTSLLVRLLTKAAGMPTGKGGNLPWKALLREAGLQVLSLHTDLGSLERDAAAVAQEARSLGTEFAVITGMYRFDYSSESAVRALSERLNRAGEALKKEGITLLYHNHNAELLPVSPEEKAYDLIIRETDPALLSFEFDSYWFTEAGADAAAFMRRLGKRMKLWHATDRGGRPGGSAMTPILKSGALELGTGSMDLPGLLKIAAENGVQGVVLETHNNWIEKDPVKSLELSAVWLRDHAASCNTDML